MVEYVDGWNARIARSRSERTCQNCGGKIYKRMRYISRDDRKGGKRWQHHEHVDCQAAWWQVELTNLLKSVGRLPHALPPEGESDQRLEGFEMLFVATSPKVGVVSWVPPQELQQRFLQTPDNELRKAAQREIQLALGLFADVIIRAMGHQRAAMQLSNVMQQLQQVAETAYDWKLDR